LIPFGFGLEDTMTAALASNPARRDREHGLSAYDFDDDGLVPNSVLPLVIMRRAIEPDRRDPAAAFERTFAQNNWTGSWRNGVFDYHHFHTTAHEVLGIASGWAAIRFGGEDGQTIEVGAGDVIVIPAGIGHKLIEAGRDLLVVGAYPDGQRADLVREDPGAIEAARARIAAVKLPTSDPVAGARGMLFSFWR
jgi:uncharacterized protein YjlB